MSSSATRLAVGLLHHRPYAGQSERRQNRIELALIAVAKGYALVEVFETGSNGLSQDLAFQELEAVARQADAAALVWGGDVDVARVCDVADRLRLMILPALSANTSGDAPEPPGPLSRRRRPSPGWATLLG
jgi:hypothetical protein